jgi:tRNA (uracil-5-)-methyltransferase
MKFRVSPDSFFQVNTPASEVLYNVISDNITTASHTLPVLYGKAATPLWIVSVDFIVVELFCLLVDLCCGTGTIGIIVAKMLGVSKLVGIELSQQAIDDAVYNAECNGITNAHFIVGKVEDVLPSLVASDTTASGETSIAIVDPPRGGLHQKVIQAIRKSNINTLIYVSCNPEGTCNNFTDLCRGRSNRIKGFPFRPVTAVPVDLFPHTTHCELVVLFQRTDQTPVTGDTTTND